MGECHHQREEGKAITYAGTAGSRSPSSSSSFLFDDAVLPSSSRRVNTSNHASLLLASVSSRDVNNPATVLRIPTYNGFSYTPDLASSGVFLQFVFPCPG